MKYSLLLISLLSLSFVQIMAVPPVVTDMQPADGFYADIGVWVTFMAKIHDPDCGMGDVHINIFGHAVVGYESRDSPSCPSGYFCKDYMFAIPGQNWWTIEVESLCAHYVQAPIHYFCVDVCPRHLRNGREGKMRETLQNR